jgi:lysophospholipase L1-like esterase
MLEFDGPVIRGLKALGSRPGRVAVTLLAAALIGSGLIAVAFAGRPDGPRNVERPKLSGEAEVGRVLRSTRGAWSGRPTRYRVRWRRCNARGRRCSAIRGASRTRYRLAARDAGHRIRSVVTASRRGSRGASGRRRRLARSASSRASRVVIESQRGVSPGAGAPTGPLGGAAPSPGSTGTSSPTPTATPDPPGSTVAPMPVISRGKPAFSNDECNGTYPAHNANDGDFETRWIACESPASGGNPKWLAYDLSTVPARDRASVVVAWFNDPITSEYDHTLTGGPGYNNVGAFSIQVNSAAGGTGAPATGWTTVQSISANTFNSRQARIDMSGANWVRLRATASDGSDGNEGIALNLDVHTAAAGVTDDWIFYGDSITQDGMHHDTRTAESGGTVRSFSDEVHALAPDHFPLFQNGGVGGLRSEDGAAHIDEWLALFPGRFVTLDFGTNDANAGAGDNTIVQPFHDNMEAMVEKVVAAGKTPIIPTIPWGATPELRANVPVLNDEIRRLREQNPEIVAGPDLYALYEANRQLIGPDGVHPTWDHGYAALRQAWARFAAGLYEGHQASWTTARAGTVRRGGFRRTRE